MFPVTAASFFRNHTIFLHCPCFIAPFQVAQSHIISISHLRVHSLLLDMSLYSFTSPLSLEGRDIPQQLYPFPHSLYLSLAVCRVCCRHSLGLADLQEAFIFFQSLVTAASLQSQGKQRALHISEFPHPCCVFSAAQLIMALKPCSDFVNSHQGRRKFTKSCQ